MIRMNWMSRTPNFWKSLSSLNICSTCSPCGQHFSWGSHNTMNLKFSVIAWETGQKTPFSVTQKPTLALRQLQEHFPHAQQMLCSGPVWVMDRRAQAETAPAPGQGWGLLGKEHNSRGRQQHFCQGFSRQHHFNSVLPDPLPFGQGNHTSINILLSQLLPECIPTAKTGGSFYPLHWNLQNLHTAFVWACTYSIFTHPFPSQKHDLEVVSKSGCQAAWPRTAKEREEPVSALCALNSITLNVKPCWWIGSHKAGTMDVSERVHSTFPAFLNIQNQHPNGCQGLLGLFLLFFFL